MFIDKQKVVEWQINAAIRGIWRGECAVSTHVIALSARQIILELAKARGIALASDIKRVIRSEHLKDFERLWKERYNFFKHADNDHADEVNIANLSLTNEIDTLYNIRNYKAVFDHSSQHMNLFGIYCALRFPNAIKLDNLEKSTESLLLDLGLYEGQPRVELCNQFATAIAQVPGLSQEFSEVQLISLSEPIEQEAKEEAPFFKRRKTTQ